MQQRSRSLTRAVSRSLASGIRDGMSWEEGVIESGIIRLRFRSYVSWSAQRLDPMGMAVSTLENAEELARNAIRRRRFFFATENG
jgi:hypothetical protein